MMVLTCDPSGNVDYTHVSCTEPQTVGELLQKYNIRCTMVWNSRLSLSATAPCSALMEHDMCLIRANCVLKEREAFRQNPSLHKNMKSCKIVTKFSAMRYRPYNIQPPSAIECAENDECVSVLYYTDSRTTLRSVLENDGRFNQEGLRFCYGSETASAVTTSHSDVYECVVVIEDIARLPRSTNNAASMCITEIEDGSVTVSSNATATHDPPNIINYSNNTCIVCTYRLVTHYLDCGHVLCLECITGISSNNRKKCPTCSVKFTHYKPIIVDLHDTDVGLNDEAVMRCRSCTRIKQWVTNCGHLSCKCYSKNCCVCRVGPVSGWLKLFI